MASLIKFVVLLCAVAAASANLVEDGLDSETLFLEDLVEFAARDQSSVLGDCQPSDKLLFAESVDVKSGLLQVKTKDITYPPKKLSLGERISCIKILDQLKNGKNASFKISSGGINHFQAIINMTSVRGEPIKYNVEIYGHV